MIVGIEEIRKKWKSALHFCEYDIFCHASRTQDVRWEVCTHVKEGLCTANEGTKRYQPKIGNTAFHRHIEVHKNRNT